MKEKEIIYENVNSEEYLTEMAQFQPKGGSKNFGFLVTVNKENREGICYFKVYNASKYSSATKVLRISFKNPTVIKNHAEIGGKKEWKISEVDSGFKKDLIEYLNSKSSGNPDITVWTAMRFYWNEMYDFVSDISDYISGKYDTPQNLKNPNYISYNIQMPDYNELK